MKLNDKQIKRLSEVLELFENATVRDAGIVQVSGSFAKAEMFNYDKDYIDIELKWGVQSDVSDNVHVEQWRLKTNLLDKEMSTEELLFNIES